VVGKVAKLRLGPLGAFQRRDDDRSILILELVEHGLDRRLTLTQQWFERHRQKVVPPMPRVT
jgi:hypothetical protein